MKIRIYSFLVLVASALSGCTKNEPCMLGEVNFVTPTPEMMDSCNPTKGGTREKCLALTNSQLLGVSIYRGIGPNNNKGSISLSGEVGGLCSAFYRGTTNPNEFQKLQCGYYMNAQSNPWPMGSTGCVDLNLPKECRYDSAVGAETVRKMRSLILDGTCGF